jgi:CheY-like chemotaxis protein
MDELDNINPYKIHKRLFDPKAFFEEIQKYFSKDVLENLTKKRQINLEIDPSIDHTYQVYSDEIKLQQIIVKLLSKTLQSNQSHNIDIKASRKIKIIELFIEIVYDQTIENTSDIESARNRYAQISEDVDLNIIKEAISILGGELYFKMNEGKGYSIKLIIPYGTPDDKCKRNEHKNICKEYDWKGKSILIVDDEEPNFFLTTHLLKDTGAYFEWAKDGKEGIELALKNDYDLIIMDVKMPNIDGLEATKYIKKHKPEVPIIIQTAHAMISEQEKAFEAGCNEYFTKPLIITDFISKLNIYVNK